MLVGSSGVSDRELVHEPFHLPWSACRNFCEVCREWEVIAAWYFAFGRIFSQGCAAHSFRRYQITALTPKP